MGVACAALLFFWNLDFVGNFAQILYMEKDGFASLGSARASIALHVYFALFFTLNALESALMAFFHEYDALIN